MYYKVKKELGEERLYYHQSCQAKVVWGADKRGRKVPFLMSYSTIICACIDDVLYACCGSHMLSTTTKRHLHWFNQQMYLTYHRWPGIAVSIEARLLFRFRNMQELWEMYPVVNPSDYGVHESEHIH